MNTGGKIVLMFLIIFAVAMLVSSIGFKKICMVYFTWLWFFCYGNRNNLIYSFVEQDKQ